MVLFPAGWLSCKFFWGNWSVRKSYLAKVITSKVQLMAISLWIHFLQVITINALWTCVALPLPIAYLKNKQITICKSLDLSNRTHSLASRWPWERVWPLDWCRLCQLLHQWSTMLDQHTWEGLCKMRFSKIDTISSRKRNFVHRRLCISCIIKLVNWLLKI